MALLRIQQRLTGVYLSIQCLFICLAVDCVRYNMASLAAGQSLYRRCDSRKLGGSASFSHTAENYQYLCLTPSTFDEETDCVTDMALGLAGNKTAW